MEKSWFLRGIRVSGGRGKAPTTAYTGLFSGQGGSSSPCYALAAGWPRAGALARLT